MNNWQRAVWNPHTGKVELRDVAEYQPAELSEHEKLTQALDAAQDDIRELTRQRDQARDIAIRCGAWQNGAGTDFEAHLDRSEPQPLVDPDGVLFGGAS